MKTRTLIGYGGGLVAGAVLFAAAVGFSLPAYAATCPVGSQCFETAPGQLSFDGLPLDATAVFTVSAGNIQLVLTNLQSSVTASQLLADVSFTASGATGTGPFSGINPTTATYITDDSNGNRTSAGAQNLPWTLTNTGGSSYHFTGIGNPSAAGLIIGPVTNSNASIDQHNPYIDGTATFNLAIAGVSSDTIISAVNFSFGTNEETVTVPIPAAVWLFVSGLLGLIGIARRKLGGPEQLGGPELMAA